MTGTCRSLQIVILSSVAALIVVLCALVVIGIERNRAMLLEAVGIATEPPPDLALAGRKAQAPDLQRVLGESEFYPEEARDRNEQGLTVAQLWIASSGTVEQCAIAQSSGSRSLDAATCALAREKVRFEPARDRFGRAIASTYALRMRWMLPERTAGWTR